MDEIKIPYKDKEITEYEAIKLISKGTDLDDFAIQTKLMCLALVTYQKDGWEKVPEMYWNKRLASLAVKRDFHALEKIPAMFYPSCMTEFACWGNKLTEKNEQEWVDALNRLDKNLIKKTVKKFPRLLRFVSKENMTNAILNTSRGNEMKVAVTKEVIPEFPGETFEYSFEEDKDIIDPNAFFLLDPSEQTKERLMRIVDSDVLLPPDFIARLSTPNKNAYYYKKAGDTEMADYWEKRILKYLGRDLCLEIARKHPEGSIKTSPYLTKEGVLDFWNRISPTMSNIVMTTYFMSFPPEVLDSSMADNIILSWEVLAYAPDVLCGTARADAYLKRNPWDILRLPECYQTTDRLIAAGVKLTKETVRYIKNEDQRNKIKLALNIK